MSVDLKYGFCTNIDVSRVLDEFTDVLPNTLRHLFNQKGFLKQRFCNSFY